jgi:hypothetical protein
MAAQNPDPGQIPQRGRQIFIGMNLNPIVNAFHPAHSGRRKNQILEESPGASVVQLLGIFVRQPVQAGLRRDWRWKANIFRAMSP